MQTAENVLPDPIRAKRSEFLKGVIDDVDDDTQIKMMALINGGTVPSSNSIEAPSPTQTTAPEKRRKQYKTGPSLYKDVVAFMHINRHKTEVEIYEGLRSRVGGCPNLPRDEDLAKKAVRTALKKNKNTFYQYQDGTWDHTSNANKPLN